MKHMHTSKLTKVPSLFVPIAPKLSAVSKSPGKTCLPLQREAGALR